MVLVLLKFVISTQIQDFIVSQKKNNEKNTRPAHNIVEIITSVLQEVLLLTKS